MSDTSSSTSLPQPVVHTNDVFLQTSDVISPISAVADERTTKPEPSTEAVVDEPTNASDEPTNTSDVIPIPPPTPRGGVSILAHKLWIGNLDKRLTEQNILKFVTQYGTVVSFRYLFKTSSERVEPRGYVFVEYATREEAERAKVGLDGKKALGRRIIVDWARTDFGIAKKTQQITTVSDTWDATTVSRTLDSKASTTSKIAALEAKLRQMDEPDAKRPRLLTRPTHTLTVRQSKRPVY